MEKQSEESLKERILDLRSKLRETRKVKTDLETEIAFVQLELDRLQGKTEI